MGVFGDRWTNNNELKSCNETKGDTTEPQPTRCRHQRDIKKTFAGRDKWLLRMRTLLHRNTDRFHLFIRRTSHESLFHKSCITHHPNCHPQRKDTCRRHLPSGKTELCGYHHWAHAEQNISISSLAPYNKTECLTTYTEETSHTNNLTKKKYSTTTIMSHALEKTQKKNATCVQQFRTTIILPIILLSLKERPPRTNKLN